MKCNTNVAQMSGDGPDFEDGPDEDGFKGPRPYNGFASHQNGCDNPSNAVQDAPNVNALIDKLEQVVGEEGFYAERIMTGVECVRFLRETVAESPKWLFKRKAVVQATPAATVPQVVQSVPSDEQTILLRKLAQSYAWRVYGECRGFYEDGAIPKTEDILEAVRLHLLTTASNGKD